jgi:hypothetical protein
LSQGLPVSGILPDDGEAVALMGVVLGGIADAVGRGEAVTDLAKRHPRARDGLPMSAVNMRPSSRFPARWVTNCSVVPMTGDA